MPSLNLPCLNGASPDIMGEAPGLLAFLAPPNDPRMVARMGLETVLLHQNNEIVLEGERFSTRDGWVQGRRYLALDNNGSIIGALNVTLSKRGRKVTAIASNVVVRPDHRRKGVAYGLLQSALSDYPGMVADTTMTTDGAALLGKTPRKSFRP